MPFRKPRFSARSRARRTRTLAAAPRPLKRILVQIPLHFATSRRITRVGSVLWLRTQSSECGLFLAGSSYSTQSSQDVRISRDAPLVAQNGRHTYTALPNPHPKPERWSPETATTPLCQNRERMVLARTRSHYILTSLLHSSYSRSAHRIAWLAAGPPDAAGGRRRRGGCRGRPRLLPAAST